ncbi:MAG: hypothetical protein LBR40_01025 [Bacilli bacterium]|jgi:type IV secretory pathway component VirB8|nr:hypothetical protein [Bacilli bacterium]
MFNKNKKDNINQLKELSNLNEEDIEKVKLSTKEIIFNVIILGFVMIALLFIALAIVRF